jgi:signal transduction histidine kinase
MNLIENADKYSPTGTPIDVRLIGHDDTMEITVTDQGIGIPEADQEHIFERFYRASNTKSVEGSGMGLAVAKILVESMGGTISVSSQIGSGTVFQLSFPLITTPSPQETVAIPAASRA